MARTSSQQTLDPEATNNATYRPPDRGLSPFREPIYGSPGDDYCGQAFDERDMKVSLREKLLSEKNELTVFPPAHQQAATTATEVRGCIDCWFHILCHGVGVAASVRSAYLADVCFST